MATANFTADGKQEHIEQFSCSAGLTAGIHGQLTFLTVLNISLSITAFLGNALILVALRKESSLHSPSKLLLRCLTISDLCVGLISEPLYVTFWMSVMKESWNVCRYVTVARLIINPILCGVSLYTLTAISVDRLLALLLGLKYKQVVTLKRTYVVVATFWVVSTVYSIMFIWNIVVPTWGIIFSISLCLVTSIFSYTKIFLNFRHRAQQKSQESPLNIARYRKAVSTALWLQLTLVACYLPHGIVVILVAKSGLSATTFIAAQFTTTLVFLNSSLNPILYSWKIDEVRQAVKDTIRQVLCCPSS